MYVGIADKYGQVVGISKNEKLRVSIDESYKSNSNATTYSPSVSGTTEYYSDKGVYIIDGIKFTGTPGANYKLKFFSDAIDMSKPSNQELL